MQRYAIAVIVLLCAAGAQGRSHPKHNHTGDRASNDWDFYLLRIEWPGGYQANTWDTCVKTWTLHGLWPTRNDTSYPQTCSNTAFDYSKLSNITNEMECSWPSCCGSNEDFWKHEWTKHGTCAMSNSLTSDEQQYFGASLALLKKVNIYSVLESNGITPSYTQSYTLDEIKSALQSTLHVTPIPKCTGGRIESVDLCVSKSLKIYECLPAFANANTGCSKTTVWYNPVKYNSE